MYEQEKKNAILNGEINIKDTDIDFDSLEEKLENELESRLSELDFLEKEKEQIGNPDELGEMIKNVVWEQFLNQIAVTAGEDFIEANRGLTLDLRSKAHIQTTKNFAEGKIASHNTDINYKERYDSWQSNFQKDENGKIITHTTRTGKEEATLVKGARNPFDKNRPSGSSEKNTDIDHTVSAAEIIRDPAANAHMTKEEQINFANSDANLNEINSSLNRSKGDKSTTDWLDNPNYKGQKPSEIFNITEEEEKNLRQKDIEARKELDKQKKEAEERSIKVGKKSQREEAFRIGGKALRAIAMQLLAELIKEVIGKLVKWFKYKKRSIDSLVDSLKIAINSFISKLKTHMINASNILITTIATSIIGPVVGTIKKVWTMLKQGWKSLKEAISFLKKPENKYMPMSIKVLEVGKIIMAGLSGIGALALGEVIEKSLMTIPIFTVEIPLLGSFANIVGVFIGAVVAGIIGAIVINLIDKATEKKRKQETVEREVQKGNGIIKLQRELYDVTVEKYVHTKEENINNIRERHRKAVQTLRESLEDIFENESKDNSIDFDEIDSALDDLLD